MIESNPDVDYDFIKTYYWNNCIEAKKIVSQAVKNVKKTPFGKDENGKAKKKTDLIKSISSYATESNSETMAEAFADVYANGTEANPLSIEKKSYR